MRLRLVVATLVFLLSATAFGHDADWWYEKYQKLGDTNPKWDALVREGIDHWQATSDAESDLWRAQSIDGELALSAKALEKAYAAGCRCPIMLYIDARNLCMSGGNAWDRFDESLKRTEKRPDLTFVRIRCANTLAWRLMHSDQFEEAVPYFEMALSLSSPDVEEGIFKEVRSGLQQAQEKLATLNEQTAQLAAITLPPNPTKEQVRAYVREILILADKKPARSTPAQGVMLNILGPGHFDLVFPEVAKLEKVGPENLDVLLEIWGTTGGTHDHRIEFYVKGAVEKLARPKDMALLLRWLPRHEPLREVIERKRRPPYARAFLLGRIAERAANTDKGILDAVIALRDPATYDDLIWQFENNIRGACIYDELRNLPGIQLKNPVLRLWEASKSWPPILAFRRYSAAPAAIDYGVTDALEFAVQNLDSREATGFAGVPERLREAIRQRTGQSGSDDEIRAWFKANSGKLVFDENKRTFQPKP